jgi:hypothetical protein
MLLRDEAASDRKERLRGSPGSGHGGRVGRLVHDRTVAAARDTQVVKTPDRRTITFAEWGVPEGSPVISLHGAPGSRFARLDETMLVDVGARLITY